MPKRTRLGGVYRKVSTFREFAEASQRVLLQMRVVRDSLRNLLSDFERLEAAVAELQTCLDETEVISSSPPIVTVVSERPRVLRLVEVAQTLGLCRSTIYRMMQEGRFPKPLHLSGRAVRWSSEDIAAWLSEHR